MNRLSTAVFGALAGSLVAAPAPAAVINVPGDAPKHQRWFFYPALLIVPPVAPVPDLVASRLQPPAFGGRENSPAPLCQAGKSLVPGLS